MDGYLIENFLSLTFTQFCDRPLPETVFDHSHRFTMNLGKRSCCPGYFLIPIVILVGYNYLGSVFFTYIVHKGLSTFSNLRLSSHCSPFDFRTRGKEES